MFVKLMYIVFVFLLSVGNSFYSDYQVQEDYIPILGYHQIDTEITKTKITLDRFKEQVEFLTKDYGCNWITMDTMIGYIKRKEKLPTKACVMNFDDSATSQLLGLCVLNKLKVPATYYIVENNLAKNINNESNEDWIMRGISIDGIDKRPYNMYPEDIKILYKWGHDIGAHTLNHKNLANLNYNEQKEEILGSIVGLKERGYNVSSFAYPFGSYIDTTLKIVEDIIEDGHIVLARDTEKDNTWREQRSAVFNVNPSNNALFNYIKPEFMVTNKKEVDNQNSFILDKIAYNGWWQFEENYLAHNASKVSTTTNTFDVPVYNDNGYHRIDPLTFAVLAIYGEDAVLETNFATKYKSGITVDIFSGRDQYGTGAGYTVEIDGVMYYPTAQEPESEWFIENQRTFNYYQTFYVDIPDMEPGLHVMKLHKTDKEKILLDRFRVFAEKNQDFYVDTIYNYECKGDKDPNCNCKYIDGYTSPGSGNNWWDFNIEISETTAILILCITIGALSICLCVNSGSNREFKKYGHIKKQRELYLGGQLPYQLEEQQLLNYR